MSKSAKLLKELLEKLVEVLVEEILEELLGEIVVIMSISILVGLLEGMLGGLLDGLAGFMSTSAELLKELPKELLEEIVEVMSTSVLVELMNGLLDGLLNGPMNGLMEELAVVMLMVKELLDELVGMTLMATVVPMELEEVTLAVMGALEEMVVVTVLLLIADSLGDSLGTVTALDNSLDALVLVLMDWLTVREVVPWFVEGSTSVLEVSAASVDVEVALRVCVEVRDSDELSGGCCCEGDGLRLEEVMETDVASPTTELAVELSGDGTCDSVSATEALLASMVDEVKVAEGA